MNASTLQLALRQAEWLAAPDADLLRRFAATRDEPAFAELVRRHGPMVWGACRHLLPGHADAEDAFQATFLALARSAGSIHRAGAVGGWLHGVAVRAATKLKRSAARRRAREQRAAGGEADQSVPEASWEALLAAVHEEVQRLPDPLRTAFVLCDLEGVRQPDAAARLGWKPGTLTGRLTRARQLLLDRLTSRGLAPAAACGAVGLGVAAAAGAVPARLVGKVVSLIRPGGAVPPVVLELVREVTPMALSWTKRVAAVALVAGGIGAALFPMAQAQQQGGGAPQPAGPRGGGGLGSGMGQGTSAGPLGGVQSGGAAGSTARPAWEYKYVQQRREAVLFKQTVTDFGAAGWEYCDHLELTAAARGEAATDLLVFKRPGGGARGASSGAAGGGAGGGSGFHSGGMNPFGPGGAGGPLGPPGAGNSRPGATEGGGGSYGAPPGKSGGGDSLRPPMGSGSGTGGGGRGAAGGAGPKAGPGGADEMLVTLKGQHVRAEEAATTLRLVFARHGAEFIVDARTNSLIVRGSPQVIDQVKAILSLLDTPAPARPQGM
jgi:RNA polymerase sigma factor (sigma-70 family)